MVVHLSTDLSSRVASRCLQASGHLALLLLLTSASCQFDVGGLASDASESLADSASGYDALIPTDGWLPPDARPPIDADLDPSSVLISTPLSGEIDLDAESWEWTGAAWLTFDIADAALRLWCSPMYTDSASVRFASMHDSSNIYFFFEVTDDVISTDGPYLTDDDALVIYLDAAGDKSGPYGWDDHKLALSDGYWQDYASEASPVTLNGDYQTTGSGYNFEIRIRKSSLGANPLGSTLGFDLLISDDDFFGAEADCWGVWYVSDGPHCDPCCDAGEQNILSCDTTAFGTLLLQ